MANLERQYIIPLRKEWLKVPKYQRAKKAMKALKEFIAKHFRVEMEDVKVGKWLNEALWSRGIKNPPHKIKVKAVRDEKNIVKVELFELHEKAKKFEEKEAKRKSTIEGKKKEVEAKKKAEEEAAKKEADALAKKGEEMQKEGQEKADKAQEINKEEEKLMKKDMGKEHHAKPSPNLPHEKAQSKHPVRQSLEK